MNDFCFVAIYPSLKPGNLEQICFLQMQTLKPSTNQLNVKEHVDFLKVMFSEWLNFTTKHFQHKS